MNVPLSTGLGMCKGFDSLVVLCLTTFLSQCLQTKLLHTYTITNVQKQHDPKLISEALELSALLLSVFFFFFSQCLVDKYLGRPAKERRAIGGWADETMLSLS